MKQNICAVSSSSHRCWEVTMPHNWIALWNSSLNYSVGYPLLSNLLQKVLFFSSSFLFSRAGKVLQFHYAGGLGAVSFERCVCLASGPNYLRWWALISVSERRENNLYNSSSQLEAELWDSTKLCSIPQCQFALIRCSRENVMAITVRIGKHSQQNEKTVIGPVLSIQS